MDCMCLIMEVNKENGEWYIYIYILYTLHYVSDGTKCMDADVKL